MKNIKTLGIIAMVAIITFAMVACGDGGGGSKKHTHEFSGEWFGDETGHWQICPDDREKGPVAPHTAGGGICLKCGYNSPIVSVEALATYLGLVSGGTSANDPLELKVAIDLGNGSQADSGWQKLLAALDAADKFVDLDLSDCTVTEFNTGAKFNGGWVFPDGMDKIVSLTLPNSVTTIGFSAFEGCTSLTSVTIGNSVTSIGDSAFYGTSLTSVTIPNSVTNIGNSAFVYCSGLTSVIFGGASTTIDDDSFSNAASLKTAYETGKAGT